jgi:hypothetical protein
MSKVTISKQALLTWLLSAPDKVSVEELARWIQNKTYGDCKFTIRQEVENVSNRVKCRDKRIHGCTEDCVKEKSW